MVTLEQVATEILRRSIVALKENTLSLDGCRMAQMICFEQRDNEELAAVIKEYTDAADAITDGYFSAIMESLKATKQ